MTAAPLTLGTAGHVDHGKTALVRALTGRDTDRLAQEKERGLSIELGYAPLELPSGRRLSVVDVPGHERFVRTMVAGATGVDLFLLCVAADDGVMPQTLEHLAVLRALGVPPGPVAVTKADVAAPDAAARQVEELLPGAEAVPVASPDGAGLDRLLDALDRAAAALPGRAGAPGPARLHVDRSFSLHGIGTVVTGTLWAGAVAPGERLLLLPAGDEVRVRGVHVHDEPRERAEAGQRVALNLAGIGHREVGRGDVLCDPASGLRPSYAIDAELRLEERARPLRRGARVQVHHGTREAPARVVPLEGDDLEPSATGLCQLRLEAPLIAWRGDRLVLRQIAPPDTIGGGDVIDPTARRSRRALRDAPPPARPTEPEPPGDDALRLAELVLAGGERPRADAELEAEAGVAGAAATRAWRQLERAGIVVRTGPNLHFHRDALGPLAARVLDLCRRDGATIAEVRDELGTSRRYAQALLEHLDATKATIRRGDRHVARGRS